MIFPQGAGAPWGIEKPVAQPTIFSMDGKAFICSMERFDAKTAHDYYEDVRAGRAEPFCESCKSALHDLVMETIVYGN